MNGLNSPALHVGVDLFLPLADTSSVLKELYRHWLHRLWAVGVFIDGGSGILCDNVHCRYFSGAAVGTSAQRSGEPLATNPYEALQLTDRVFSHLKLAKADRNTGRNLYSLFFLLLLDVRVFCFKGNCLRKCASMAFSADNIASLPGIYSSM